MLQIQIVKTENQIMHIDKLQMHGEDKWKIQIMTKIPTSYKQQMIQVTNETLCLVANENYQTLNYCNE